MIFYDPNALCVRSPYFPFWFLSAVVYFVNREWLVRMSNHIARGRHALDPSSPSFVLMGVFVTRCTCMHSEPTKSVVVSQATKRSRVVETQTDSLL